MSVATTVSQVYVARLKPGGDLAQEVAAFLEKNGVRFGMVSIIGALEHATLGAYHFAEKKYVQFEVPGESEILHLTGNVSLLDGRPFAHLHAILSRPDGQTAGGHVFPGCRIKVAECVVLAFSGEPLERVVDPETGLKLWKSE